jgi:hypothetical protein
VKVAAKELQNHLGEYLRQVKAIEIGTAAKNLRPDGCMLASPMPDEPAPAPPPTPPVAAEAASPGEAPKPARPRAPGAGRSTQARNPLPFVVLVIVLCIAGWFIVSWMSDTSSLQDCVMSGRKNCAPVDPKLGR